MTCPRTALALLLGLSLVAESQTLHKPSAAPTAKPAEDAQLYRNTTFGFRYQIPYGWVDRTKDMREQEATEKPDAKEKASNLGKGEVLLAVFERPPEATGETINSAVVIAAESAGAYPGLKKAEDYLGPLTELTTSKGFKAEGNPAVIEIDARQLVRADFTKVLNDKLTMRQATLVLLTHGQIVSFTFIAGSEDELDNLIDNLHFGPTKPPAH
ncbi:MAG: hypothetical protein LAO22_12195 [Acidobacteriia bacterium]|nr:hypothetical protein [Terriglobia bacterium]